MNSTKKSSQIKPELCQKLVDEYQNHLVEVQLDNKHLTKTNGGQYVHIWACMHTYIFKLVQPILVCSKSPNSFHFLENY